MHYLDSTIAAIATPLGQGGIGIVRISGKQAISIVDRIFYSPKGKKLKDAKSHTIIYGFVVEPQTAKKIDEVLVSIMRAPNTYTREDVVEINCHGGILPLRKTLELLVKHGVRIAEPGEFTKRAFLNGRIDLSQAEAVIDIINAKTVQAERLAIMQLEGRLSEKIREFMNRITDICAYIEACIDFPEDEIETITKTEMSMSMKALKDELTALSKSYEHGRLFKEGISAAIVGKPNVGKSSLLNALLQKDRAIVTSMPGTTRDIIEDYININGLPLTIMDTAGIRESHELAEIEGVKRSLKAIEQADIVVAVFDCSRLLDDADNEIIKRVRDKKTLFVINKSDIERPDFSLNLGLDVEPIVKVSALNGAGVEELKEAIYSICMPAKEGCSQEGLLITNLRHSHLIKASAMSLQEALDAFINEAPLEIVAVLMRESLDSLGEIIGAVTTEDILNKIFSEFCIGK